MSVPKYEDNGAITIPSELNLARLAGESVIVTGGANGLGLAYTEAFSKAGAFVTIADFDEEVGKAVASKLPNTTFVKCDIRQWDDQVAAFETAIAKSPRKSVDIVIANAGVIGGDELAILQDLRILDTNLYGTVYTAKLALHYFRRQPLQEQKHDRCLVIQGSLSSYTDQPGSPQYNISKWAGRALFRNLRTTSWQQGVRVNFVAPWYVRTASFPQVVADILASKGVQFATLEDCAQAMLLIASDTNLNGRAFGVVPRDDVAGGILDLASDDYHKGDRLKGWQDTMSTVAETIADLV